MAPTQLPDAWREEARLLRRYAAEQQAATLEQAARQLAEQWAAWQDELVPLAVAAAESGYSDASLRRMARECVLPNRAAEGEYLFRRGDLPRKPGHGVAGSDPVPQPVGPAAPPEPVNIAPRPGRPHPDRRQVARAVVSGGRH
jgi:hypothetical protein